MTEILILLNDPPYGTERSCSGLRTVGGRRSSMDELTRHALAAGKVLVF